MDFASYTVRVKEVDTIRKKVTLELAPSRKGEKLEQGEILGDQFLPAKIPYDQKIENELIKAAKDANEISVKIKDNVVINTV